MAGLADRWRRARRACRAFRGAEDGAAAVEFALIAAPFFFMLFAIMEVALIVFVTTALENATTEAARQIRTGSFQASGGGAAEFIDEICDRGVLLDCSRLSVDVRTFQSFGAIDPANPLDDDGNLREDEFLFVPGAGRTIVLVRVFYQMPMRTPILSRVFSNMAGNELLLTSAASFRNEPFAGPPGQATP